MGAALSGAGEPPLSGILTCSTECQLILFHFYFFLWLLVSVFLDGECGSDSVAVAMSHSVCGPSQGGVY